MATLRKILEKNKTKQADEERKSNSFQQGVGDS